MTLRSAIEQHQAGNLGQALHLYEQVLQTAPENADAWHLMGNAACQLGDPALGARLIGQASTLAPNNTTYLLSLAMALRAAGDHAGALASYERILVREPLNASAYFGLGNTAEAQGRPEQAADHFRHALALAPDLFEARFNLANLDKAHGRYDDAVVLYRQVLAQQPDFAAAHHNLGGALAALGHTEQALACYQRALSAQLPETYNNIGNIHAARGEMAAALACYRQAISILPEYAEAYANLGNTLLAQGQLELAAEALREVLRLTPGSAEAHLRLGDVLLAADAVDAAAEQFQLAGAIAPASAPAHAQALFNLGVARERQDDLGAARRCFEQAAAARPDDLDTLYNLGAVYGRLGRMDDAERCYRALLVRAPDHVDGHINLSTILLDDGRKDEARHHIEHAYRLRNLFERRAPQAAKTVLILFDAGKGNLNLTHLFRQRSTTLLDWMIEYAPPGQAEALPPYDLVFNATGDPDLTGATAAPLRHFLGLCRAPLLNHPDQVARTARHQMPALLDGIAGLLVPPVWRYAAGVAWDPALAGQLPLMARPVDAHGGQGLTLLADAAALALCRAEQTEALYLSRFIDYRSADGCYRKYRIIYIDRQPFPYHLAISPHWIVHYYSADMEGQAWKLDEERAFLADPAAVLGAGAMAALTEIGRRLDLDYAGIDFSLLPDGRVLVFEANPTMLVHPEAGDGPLAHKNGYVTAILDAFEALQWRRIDAGRAA